MNEGDTSTATWIYWKLLKFMRKCIYCILSSGPIPRLIAFIMDGNRRYAKKWNLIEGAGHNAGFLALMSLLIYCCELDVKFVTAYAFSVDNFKRKPEEVQSIMDLMREKIELLIREDSIVHHYRVKVIFSGNLQLLSEPVREAAMRLMVATASHSKLVLTICIVLSSTDEIMHAIQESCKEKRDDHDFQELKAVDDDTNKLINLVDIEKHMYMAIAPDPDILIRTSGENRLSNFLLWQSSYSHLYSALALWPEISFWHLVWVVLNFQQNHSYLEKKKKLLQILHC